MSQETMTKLQEAADWLRDHSWNNVTPRKLMERFNLTSVELRQLCKENRDITILMHVEKPDVPYNEPPTFAHVKDHMGDLTPNEIGQLWRDIITLLLQQAFVSFSRVHRATGENHLREEGPVPLEPLSASDWPEMWWQAESQLIGGKRYKLTIESEWTVKGTQCQKNPSNQKSIPSSGKR